MSAGSLVLQPARWVFCPDCKLHGRLVTSSGKESQEVCSKELAHQVVSDFLKDGHLVSEETVYLRKIIDESEMLDDVAAELKAILPEIFQRSTKSPKDRSVTRPIPTTCRDRVRKTRFH